ncbi:MAG: M15 family metallopeptidase [Candidatus Limnocylindria bacterium]
MIRFRLALIFAVLASNFVAQPPQVAAAAPPFTDVVASPFKADIEWLYLQGVTSGCTSVHYCPEASVTREQMATFLVRLFALPATTQDAFVDDDGSMHENNINRVAAVGVTGGCAPARFCPGASVTREQMASFLARAAEMGFAGGDYFLDDERSTHEADINRVAAAGVTGGCGEYRYCPTASVTRGQMAAFLHRTRDPGPVASTLPEAGPLPACSYEDQPTARIGYHQWQRTHLDTIYSVSSSYRPPDLIDSATAGANGGHSARSVARADLAALFSGARSAGHSLRIVSAFRSYETQVATFNDNVARYGLATALRRSARPGHSEHQLGTTVDFSHAGGAAPWSYADWATHPAGAWMRDHAWRYGWVMSYPMGASETTCYDYEPWHYRYVGRPMASSVQASGLTLREYLWRINGDDR